MWTQDMGWVSLSNWLIPFLACVPLQLCLYHISTVSLSNCVSTVRYTCYELHITSDNLYFYALHCKTTIYTAFWFSWSISTQCSDTIILVHLHRSSTGDSTIYERGEQYSMAAAVQQILKGATYGTVVMRWGRWMGREDTIPSHCWTPPPLPYPSPPYTPPLCLFWVLPCLLLVMERGIDNCTVHPVAANTLRSPD